MLKEQTEINVGTISESTLQSNQHISISKQFYNCITSICSFQNKLGINEYRKDRRINGLQFPLHPLQILGWIIIILFIYASYMVLIPSFHPIIEIPLYWTYNIILLIHIISHLASLIIDPADKELRKISIRKIVPEFDRHKHSHVIENGRCHLCNIKTSSSRTKHCSICNKCIEQFDHHCKYLNQCIGSRNYIPFIICIVSAVIAILIILGTIIAQLILFIYKSKWLIITMNIISNQNITIANTTIIPSNDYIINNTDNNNNYSMENVSLDIGVNNSIININDTSIIIDDETNNGIGIKNTIYLIFVAFIGIIAAVAAGLLLHLCIFHMYISYLGVTTYEYIRKKRENNTIINKSNANNDIEHKIFICSHINSNTLYRPQHNIRICNQMSRKTKTFNNNPQHINSLTTSSNRNDESLGKSYKVYVLCSLLSDISANVNTNLSNQISEYSMSCKDKSSKSSSSNIIKGKKFLCCSHYKSTQRNDNSHINADEIIENSICANKCKLSLKYRNILHDGNNKINDNNIESNKNSPSKQRWKQKWNCCLNVPDSPIEPMTSNIQTLTNIIPTTTTDNNNIDIVSTMTDNINIDCDNKIQSIKNINSIINSDDDSKYPNRTTNGNYNKKLKASKNISKVTCQRQLYVKLSRPWPLRMRRMLRAINRYRHTKCQNTDELTSQKHNQIRPMPTNDYNNDDILHKESISIIHSYPRQPPPPIVRRKLKRPTNLENIVDAMLVMQNPGKQNINRTDNYKRRKNIWRNKSSNLSPIHETGLSNSTSPQLYRNQSFISD